MVWIGSTESFNPALSLIIGFRGKGQSAIPIKSYSLNPAWVEQVTDATRQAVECR